jgi:hypothetical protein
MYLPKDFDLNYQLCFSLVILLILFDIFLSLNLAAKKDVRLFVVLVGYVGTPRHFSRSYMTFIVPVGYFM